MFFLSAAPAIEKDFSTIYYHEYFFNEGQLTFNRTSKMIDTNAEVIILNNKT